MSKYKHLLWDIDGTLIDTYMANIVSIIELLDRYQPGHNYKVDDLAYIFGLPGKEALRELGVPEDKMASVMDEWEGLVRERCDMCKAWREENGKKKRTVTRVAAHRQCGYPELK